VDYEELARAAVEVVAGRLARRGTEAAGELTDAALDGVHQLISRRLRSSATGLRVLEAFERAPVDPQSRMRVAEMVTDEANSDRHFADSLGRAVANAGVFVQGQGATYQRNTYDASGDLRDFNTDGGDVHVGDKKTIRIGTGWLAAIVVGLIVLAGGGTAAVVTSIGKSVDLVSAVGNWEQQPGQQLIPGWTVGPLTLAISADGRFTLSMRANIEIPDDAGGSGPPPGFGDFSFDCTGTVTPDGDHFTLRTTSGQCGTFEAKPGPDDNVLDVFVDNGSANGSLALSRVSAQG
jgi:hypothetical protein